MNNEFGNPARERHKVLTLVWTDENGKVHRMIREQDAPIKRRLWAT